MWKLMMYPSTGAIPNVAWGKEPGILTPEERVHLRALASRVAEIAAAPVYAEKKTLWRRHNDLERPRPMLLVFPEDGWTDVLPVASTVTVKDPFWGQYEWILKHLIHRHERLHDDFVVEPVLNVPLAMKMGGWGIEAAKYHETETQDGSFNWTPPLQDPDDLKKMHPATLEADFETMEKQKAALEEVFGGIVRIDVAKLGVTSCIYDIATHLRGIQQCMLDMYDRPEWLHELMSFLSGEAARQADFAEKNNLLMLNNGYHYIGSGGLGYTSRLPAQGFDGEHVRPEDVWGVGIAQGASEIGPEQHDEFILRYEEKLLARCGLVAYGCCEPYTHKFDVVKRRLPNLRRMSVSPWCDVEKAAEALQDRYIFSWKPNPAMLLGTFDSEAIRRTIRRTLDVACGCAVEIILKDTMTFAGEPQRLESFIRIAREEIDRKGLTT